MGGHGGLNILPQKRWNVYNLDNREKVRQDQEAAAKEEQLQRQQSRKRDAEFRLEQLRTARGLPPVIQGKEPTAVEANPAVVESKSAAVDLKPGHINLLEGIKICDPIKGLDELQLCLYLVHKKPVDPNYLQMCLYTGMMNNHHNSSVMFLNNI